MLPVPGEAFIFCGQYQMMITFDEREHAAVFCLSEDSQKIKTHGVREKRGVCGRLPDSLSLHPIGLRQGSDLAMDSCLKIWIFFKLTMKEYEEGELKRMETRWSETLKRTVTKESY